MSEEIDRKIAVIFATDVVSYSKHMEANESETVKNLRSCERILSKLFKKHGGSLFNTGGDSFLAEFPSAVGAVECAVEFQNEIKTRNASNNTTIKLQFRVGVNTGDVIKEKGNLLGDGVNIAARLEALAQTGGITISKGVYDYVKGKTKHDYNDLGIQKVKQNEFHAYDLLLHPSHKRKLKTQKLNMLFVGVIAAAFVAGFMGFYYFSSSTQNIEFKIETESNLPVVLVMPFKNLNKVADGDFALGDAVTEGILSMLQKYTGTVSLPSTTSYQVKSADLTVKEIQDQYGVRFLINGSTQRISDQIRITTELFDTKENRVMWTEIFDFSENEFFKMQDQISLRLVEAMDVGTSVAESAVSSNNFKNFDDYILSQSMVRYLRQASKESWYLAESIYKKLEVSEAPEVNKAVMGAYLHLVKIFSGLSSDKKSDIDTLIKFSDRALLLEKDHSTHTLKAMIEGNILKNCEKALYHASEVEVLNPSARSIQIAGITQVNCGQVDRGINNLRRALQIIRNDTDYNITKNLMLSHILKKEFPEVVKIGQDTLADNVPETYILTAYAEAKLGNIRKAKKLIKQQKSFQNNLNVQRLKVKLSSIPRAHNDYFVEFYEKLIELGLE